MKEQDKFEELVSDALEKGSTFELPADFADRVVMKIQQQASVKEAKRDRLWLIGGIVSIIGALVYAYFNVELNVGFGAFTFLKGYSGLIIFAVIFVLALNFVDKRFLRKQVSG